MLLDSVEKNKSLYCGHTLEEIMPKTCTRDEKTCDRSEKIHLHAYNVNTGYRAYYKGNNYKMHNQRMPKQTAPTTVEGTRKIGRKTKEEMEKTKLKKT